jgi:hypothetical protein
LSLLAAGADSFFAAGLAGTFATGLAAGFALGFAAGLGEVVLEVFVAAGFFVLEAGLADSFFAGMFWCAPCKSPS